LRFNKGTLIDFGNASAFIKPCEKEFYISKRERKRLRKKVELFGKKIMQFIGYQTLPRDEQMGNLLITI
jgi:hypothetical protein